MLKTSPEGLRGAGRIAGLALAEMTLRLMENWRIGMPDNDSALIGTAVVAINVGRFSRGGFDPVLKNLNNAFPPERLTFCNVASIAAATGLNRETTRRKVLRMIELGFIVREEDGNLRFNTDILETEQMHQLLERQLEVVRRAADGLLDGGIFELDPDD
jgi:hypothetical protein